MIETTKGGVRLHLFIQPRSSSNEFVGVHNDLLKFKLTAPPVDGEANEALIAFLAKFFGVAKRDVVLVKGSTGRNKTVDILGVDVVDAKLKLGIP